MLTALTWCATGIHKALAKLDTHIAAWKAQLAQPQIAGFAPLEDAAHRFVNLHIALAEAGDQPAVRKLGDNDDNRANRQALDPALDQHADANKARISRIDTASTPSRSGAEIPRGGR